MFAANDDRKKFYTDEPVASIFDGPTVGKALSMRSSCNYPGSIIDQLKSSRTTKPFGTSLLRPGTTWHIVGTSSDTVVPSGNQSDSSSSDTDNNDNRRVPGIRLISEVQRTAENGNKVSKYSNPTMSESQINGLQAEETVVRRCQKKTEQPSSTDTESDTEMTTSGYVNKSKTSHSKSRKRRKKLTANLSGTRYDVGKSRHLFYYGCNVSNYYDSQLTSRVG